MLHQKVLVDRQYASVWRLTERIDLALVAVIGVCLRVGALDILEVAQYGTQSAAVMFT
jgi:hypothetical protein